MNKRTLPAYPLFVNDPYFSIWSPSEKLNDSNTIFWTGMERKTYGLVHVDGVTYSFLGDVKNSIKLEQKSFKVRAFSTDYTFECDKFILNLSFISPLLLNNLDTMSRPVCYLKYDIKCKENISNLKISLIFDQQHCYNRNEFNDYIIGGVFDNKKYQTAYFGLNRQHPMSHMGDSMAADWGYTYVTGNEAYFTSNEAFLKFISTGELEYILGERYDHRYIIALDSYTNISGEVTNKFLVSFDDLCSIYYFGEWLKGYYFKDGKTIFDAIDEAYNDYELTLKKLQEFEDDLLIKLEKYDEGYKRLCFASLRQSIAAHKLVENKDKELLFISKECHSNGCTATVDITYPAMPLYLLYNPKLVHAMVRPIMKFARMPIWKYPFAPHDVGTYPYCMGQVYGIKCDEKNTDRFISNSFQRERSNGIIVSHPLFHQYPGYMDLYYDDLQMSVEESSNMLIIAYSILYFSKEDSLIRNNYDLFLMWFCYLKDCGLVPKKQLCTDDFFETIDKNVNLSIKAMVGIKCFSLIAEYMNRLDDKKEALETIKAFKSEFDEYFKGFNHLPLSYGGTEESFSMKYNMIYDVIYGLNIFSKEIIDKEINYYLSHKTKYSISLDQRSDLTKTDWILHVCALVDDLEIQKELYSGIINFLEESESRVPFGDLYHTKSGQRKYFQNRPVQGGIFILLLKDYVRGNK